MQRNPLDSYLPVYATNVFKDSVWLMHVCSECICNGIISTHACTYMQRMYYGSGLTVCFQWMYIKKSSRCVFPVYEMNIFNDTVSHMHVWCECISNACVQWMCIEILSMCISRVCNVCIQWYRFTYVCMSWVYK